MEYRSTPRGGGGEGHKLRANGIVWLGLGLVLAALFVLLASSASGATVYVDDSYPSDNASAREWTTIQKGIYDAAPGDTVFVYNGSYTENVTFANNSVTLEGQSRDGVVIDRQSSAAVPVARIQANNVVLRNVTLKRGDYGVDAYGVNYHNGTLDNVTVVNINYDCIRVYQASDWTIHDTAVSSCGYSGVVLWGSGSNALNHRLWLVAVNATTYYDGLHLESTSGALISNVTVQDAGRYGFIGWYSTNSRVSNFTINSSGSHGMYFYYSSSIFFDNGSTWNNTGDGIYSYAGDYVRLDNVTIENNTGVGIDWYYSSYWTLRSVRNNNARYPFWQYYYSPIVLSYFQHDIDQSNTILGVKIVYFTNASNTSYTGPASWLAAVNSSGLNITITSAISGLQHGVWILATNGSNFTDINASNNDWNFIVERSNNNTFGNWSMTAVRSGGYGGIYLYTSHYNLIDGGNWTNTSRGYTALDFQGLSSNNTVSRVRVTGWYYGIYMRQDQSDNRVANCTFDGGYYGLQATYSTSLTLEWTVFNGTSYEMFYAYGYSGQPVDWVYIHNNTFNHSTYYYSSNTYFNWVRGGVVENNTFNDSYYGINLYYSAAILFQNNQLRGSRNYGVYGYYSEYIRLSGNTLSQNIVGGVYFDQSSYWTLRSNNWTNQSLPVVVNIPYNVIVPWTIHDADTSNSVNGLPMLWVVNATAGSWNGSYGWIAASNSSNISLTSTSPLTRNWCGILLMFVNDSVVPYANASANQWGACLFVSNGASINDTVITGNTAGGMYVWRSGFARIARVTLRPDVYRQDYGVQFDDTSHNGTLESVDCQRFSTCVRAEYYTNYIAVVDSVINDTYYGIYTYSQFGPRVERNQLTNTSYEQITISGSSGRPTVALRIANNTINHTTYYYSNGILLYYLSGGLIEDNTINDSYAEIYVYYSSDVLIQNNRISNGRWFGVYGYFSSYIRMSGNFLNSSASGGLYLDQSSYWTLRGNQWPNQSSPVIVNIPYNMVVAWATHDADTSNLVNGLPMLWVVNATTGTWNGSYGWIAASNSSNVSLTSTSPLTRNWCGILLMFVNDSVVQYVNASANQWGACLFVSNAASISDTVITGNTAGGVYVWRSGFARIARVTLRPDVYRQDYGVQFDETSHNGTLESVDCQQFSTCVRAEYYTNYIALVDSVINDTYYGIYTYSQFGPRVERNQFANTSYEQITISGSSGRPTVSLRIANNTINHTTYYYSNSILIYYEAAGAVENNSINDSYNGIYLYGLTGGFFQYNTFGTHRSNGLYGLVSNFVTLVGNVFRQGAPTGIYFDQSRYWTLSANSITGVNTPVFISTPDPVTDATLYMHYWSTDNTINGQPVRYYVNSTGVAFSGTAGWLVAVNSTFMNLSSTTTITQGYWGVLLVKVFNSTLHDSAVNGTTFSVGLYWGADNTIYNVSVNGTTYGVYLSNATRTSISGLTAGNSTVAGVYLNYASTRVNVTSSAFYANYRAILANSNSGYLNVTSNVINGSTAYGIEIDYTDNVRIVGNLINGTTYTGLYLYGSSGDHIDSLLVAGNTFNSTSYYYSYCIETYYVYSSTFDSNLLSNCNRGGIYFQYSNTNTIRAQTVRFGQYGIWFYQSDSNTLTDSTVTNQSSYVLGFDSGADFNSAYHNNFNLSSGQTYDIGTSNTYDNGYPSGGNYWSNGTHTDQYGGAAQNTGGPDGIQDSAQSLYSTKRDNYPLAEPWPPYVRLVTPANGSVIRAGTTLDYNVSYYFDAVQYALNNGTGANLSSPWDISTTNVSDGDLFVRIWANDSTGYNLNVTYNFVIDSTPPIIGAVSPAVGGTFPVGTLLNFTVSDAHLVDNVTWSNGSANNSFTAPWQISTTGWAEGDYNITITAWDLAGNSRTSVFLYKLDSTPPVITLNSPSNNSFIAVGTIIDLTVSDLHLANVTWNNGSGANALSLPFDISTAGWGDGTHNITVTANDTGGLSTVRVFTFTIDASPPQITLISPANNSVIEPGTLLDFGVTDSNLASVSWNNGSGSNPLAAPYDINTTGWADGNYNVTITANDTAGNIAVRAFHFEIDSQPPTITAISPASGSVVTAGTILDFAVSDPHLDRAVWNNGSANQTLASPYDISTTGWSDGSYTVTVYANDTLDHRSSRSISITIDSTKPTITLNAPSNNSTVRAGAIIDLSVSDANLNTVTRDNGSGSVTLLAPYDINTSGWADGTYNVTVTATDLAGNTQMEIYRFDIDSTPPAVSLDSPANGSFVRPGTFLMLTVTDAHLSAVTYNNGSGNQSLASPWDISTADWADGNYSMQVWASDTASNLGYFSFYVIVDGTSPRVNLSTPANGSVIRAGTLLNYTIMETYLGTVTWSNGSSGDRSFAVQWIVNTTGWPDGSTTVWVNASDLAGNTVQRSFVFALDTTTPSIALASPGPGSVVQAGTRINFSITDANLNTTSYERILGANSTGPLPFAVNFSIDTTGWLDGDYTIVVRAEDTAGNAANLTILIAIDSTAPGIGMFTPSNGSVIRAGTVLQFNISEAHLSNATWNNGTGGNRSFATPWSVPTDGWVDRTYNVTVNALDTAGNAASRTFSFDLDSTPPQVLLLSPANGSWIKAGTLLDFALSDAHSLTVNLTVNGAASAFGPGFDINTTGWADGAYNVSVFAADPAGNNASLAAQFFIDSTPPSIRLLNTNTYLGAGTLIRFDIADASLRRALWRNASFPSLGPFATNYTISTAGWPDGSVSVVVFADDLAGNNATVQFDLVMDSTPPTLALVSPLSALYIKSSVLVVLNISDASPLAYTVSVKGNAVTPTLLPTGEYAVDLTGLPEGDVDIAVDATDAAGNTNSISLLFKIDDTAPSLPAVLPMNFSGNEDAPFDFHATASDAVPPDQLNFTWQFDDTPRLQSLVTIYGADANWTFAEPGVYEISLFVTDPAGNANTTVYNISILDITPPSLVVITYFVNATEDLPVTLSDTSTANASDNSNQSLNWTWRAPGANLSSSGKNITWIFTTPGVYNITLTVTDPANNSAVGYVIVNVKDVTPPEVSIVGPSVVDIFVVADFTGVATDNDPRYGPANWTFNWTFENITGVIKTDSGRSSSIRPSIVGDMRVTLEVRDSAGNRNSTSIVLRVNLPPIVVGTPPTETNVSEDWSWTVDVVDPEGQPVTVNVSGPPGISVSGGTISWTPGAADVGAHDVTVGFNDGVTTVYRNFTLFVIDPAVAAGNHAPYFTSEPLLDANIVREYAYTFDARDDDPGQTERLVFRIGYAEYPGFRLDAANRTLHWTPIWRPTGAEEFLRTVNVTLIAFDGFATGEQSFTIRFRNPPNQWPTYNFGLAIPQNFKINDTYVVNIKDYWLDPDDDWTLLSFVTNDTDPAIRVAISRVLSWRVDKTNPLSPTLVFTIVGYGNVTFNLVARDPSGGKSENATIGLEVRQPVSGLPIAEPFPWWILLVGLAVVGSGVAYSIRRSGAATKTAELAVETAQKAPAQVIVQQAPVPGGEVVTVAKEKKDVFVIEGLFIIYKDGRMIYSKTDISDVKLEDPELVASMFSAVQSFIKDSFRAEGELNRLGFGENTILIERGENVFMATIIFGEPTADLVDQMRDTLRTIGSAYAGILEGWDGGQDALAGVEQYVQPLLASTAHLRRADVTLNLTEKGVKMISELEFFQGFVRLKVGVKNDSDSVITKATVSIDYNEDVLRLHHVEPETYRRQGSEVVLGVLNTGEKVSVAYYFDPQICTESQIDGVSRYRDSKGIVHTVSMKTRKAEVVCPIFFTKEHANTAMLKRLIETELNDKESKVYTITKIPPYLSRKDIFALAKEVVMSHDVHHVREFVMEEGPYHAEAWFYGETKVKGYKIVIRASVMEEGDKLEFFAASTTMKAITGLLAEFNHTLLSLIVKKYSDVKIKPEFDDALKVEVQKKALMPKMSESDLAGGETEQET